MKPFATLCALLALLHFCSTPLLAEESDIYTLPGGIRLPAESVPLANLLSEPVLLFATNAVPVSSDLALRSRLGDIRAKEQVTLLAYTPRLYFVRAKSTRGTPITGWVESHFLSSFDTNIVAEAQQRLAVQRAIDSAIKNKEVILTMTPDEVKRSLGKPDRITRSESADSQELIWSYIRYTSVPQTRVATGPDGRLYNETIYVKVPSGERRITFDKGFVSIIRETGPADSLSK